MSSTLSMELRDRASAFYEQELKRRLETTNPDDFVAIEPESKEYFLGKTLSNAIQSAREAYPNRMPFVIRVGHNYTIDLGAAAQ